MARDHKGGGGQKGHAKKKGGRAQKKREKGKRKARSKPKTRPKTRPTTTENAAIARGEKKLTACFDSLDDDGSGSIGSEELEDPLIGLGFAETREEVKAIVDSVDEDRSGLIEFDEFLGIIKNSDSSGSN